MLPNTPASDNGYQMMSRFTRTAQQLAAMIASVLLSGVAPRGFVPPVRADRTDDLIAAALAGGMIAAGGRSDWTAAAALEVFRGVREKLNEA